MTTDYDLLVSQAEALVEGIPHFISNLANICALIYNTLEDVSWAGFYLWENDRLVLGPFQGKTACIEIPSGKGVCGTSFEQDRVILVPDVHCFEGHIACDSASNSEIVLPIHRYRENLTGSGGDDHETVGVLDIDSTSIGRFTDEDSEGLKRLVRVLEQKVFI